MKFPLEVQKELLDDMLVKCRKTEIGKLYGFSDIKSREEFQSRVPIQDYEDFKPYVDRIFKGEQNITWPTEIKWFAKSSGTTNDRSKYIPVSIEALEDCHFKGGKDLLGLHVNNNPKSRIYKGKTLVLGGSSNVNEFRDDSYSGDLSAIIIKNLPLWVELKRIPNRSIALHSKWEEKLEQMALYSMDQDVSVISGVPSWTMVLIQRILEYKKTNNLLDVWPNLELFMHGGVSFNPYREQFKSLIPSEEMHYLETYNASEGFFGLQDRNGADDMLLMLDYGIYYEFIELNNMDDEHPKTLGLDEVEVGVNYALVITTNAGLWRYKIGDTVMFTSTNPFRIRVTGRTKQYINVFGEELMVDNAEKGLKIACDVCDAQITDYTVGPIYMDGAIAGAHEWVIEFNQRPEDTGRFESVLDDALRSLNSDYDAKRTNDYTLRPPVIHIASEGTFYRWMKSRGKLGGQNKVPRLANDRRYLEGVLSFISQSQLV